MNVCDPTETGYDYLITLTLTTTREYQLLVSRNMLLFKYSINWSGQNERSRLMTSLHRSVFLWLGHCRWSGFHFNHVPRVLSLRTLGTMLFSFECRKVAGFASFTGSIRSKTNENELWFVLARFPALYNVYVSYLFWLAHCTVFVLHDWPDISICCWFYDVHAIEKRSKGQSEPET